MSRRDCLVLASMGIAGTGLSGLLAASEGGKAHAATPSVALGFG